MSFPSETMETVARILAVSVLIDVEQRDIEMIEFRNAVGHINLQFRPDVILSDRKILSWFEDNKSDLETQLKADKTHAFKSKLLEQISDDELRRTLLASIFSISICDYELHHEECEYLKLATEIWKTGPVNPADIELIVS